MRKKTFKAIKSQTLLLLIFITQFQAQPALSATTYPISSDTNSSALTALDGIIVNFSNENTSLSINENKTLNSIIASNNGYGIIKFNNSNNNIIISNSIGDSLKSINSISYNGSSSTLTAQGDLYIKNGINTDTNYSGNIVLNGSAIQKIASSIGSTDYNLNQLSLNQDIGAEFKKDVYAKTLTSVGSGSEISGAGNLNFVNATFNGNSILSSSGNINIGKTTISAISGKSENSGGASIGSNSNLNINNSTTSFTDLTMTDATSAIIINNGKSLNISGNIAGDGVINAKDIQAGEAGNTLKGTLSLSGKTTQTIQASIGQSTNRLDTLNISNVVDSEGSANSSGIILNNNAYLKNIVFSNSSKTSKISIETGKSVNLTRNILESAGGKGLITGSGTLIFEGTLTQTIDSNLGSSISDRLGALEMKSSSSIILNDESYVTTLTSSTNLISPLQEFNSLINNSTLNITNLNINKSLKINGSGAFEVETLAIANGKNLTLEDNKTIKITKAITGLGAIKTNSSGTGNIFFSSDGVSDINVANQIGESNIRLNKIIANTNDKTVNLNNDVYASSIDFTNSSGQSKIVIADTKTLNINGDITNLSDSIISGSGALELSGTSKEQNIYTKIGDSANHLSNLKINNPFGATLYKNSFVDNLTLTGGVIKISDSILTINNSTAFNLTDASFTSKRVNDFGKIKLVGAFDITQSKIIFDYTNNNIDLDWVYKNANNDPNFTPKYTIIEASSLTNSNALALINVSDNSYLFDNILKIDGTNIATTIQTSDNFSEANIGVQNYQLLANVFSSSNLASKFFRISNKENLNLALMSLKPISVETFINNALLVNNTTFNAINSHIKNINSANEIDSKNKNTKNYELWGQIFGDKSAQKSNDAQQKFITNNYGGIFGVDTLIKGDSNILIGSAIALNKSRINDDKKIYDNNTNSYQITLYNKNYAKNNEGFYNKNLASLSLEKYSNSRTVIIENYQETTKSNFDGKNYSFESGIGYNFKMLDSFSIAPDFSLQYFKFSQKSYKEKGLSDSALRVKGTNYNEIITKLGIDFAGNFSHSQIQYKPNFTISWDKKLKNNRQIMESNFINNALDPTMRIKNSLVIAQKNIINLGFGLNLSDENNQKLNLKYNLQLANRFINNGGSIQYSWQF